MSFGPRASRGGTLAMVLGAFVFLRLAVASASPWAVWDDEESYNGTVALELARGHLLPLDALLYFPHEGGALVACLTAAPLVWLLGGGLMVVKLPALLLATLALWAWLLLTRDVAGSAAAMWFGVLMLLAPPILLRTQLLLWGHHESVWLFLALALLAAWRTAGAAEPVTRKRGGALTGALCAVGAGWAPLFVVAIPVVVAALWRGVTAGGRREVATPFALGAALGSLPWIALHAATGFASLDLLSRGAAAPGLGASLAKLWDLVTLHFPRSPAFDATWLSWTYAALLALGALATLGSREAGRARLVGAFLACFGVGYALSGFDVAGDAALAPSDPRSYRYLLPCFPVLLFLVAIGAAGPRAGWRRLPALGLAALGLVALATHAPPSRLGTSLGYVGYSYERFGWRAWERHAGAAEPILALAERLDPAALPDFSRGLGWGVAEFYDGDARSMRWRLAAFPVTWSEALWEGLGWGIADANRGDLSPIADAVGDAGGSPVSAAYRGAGWATGRRFLHEPERAAARLAGLAMDDAAPAFEGLGRALGEHLGGCAPAAVPGLVREASLRNALTGGVAHTGARRAQGRFLDGPMEMRWGPTAFYDYAGPECPFPASPHAPGPA